MSTGAVSEYYTLEQWNMTNFPYDLGIMEIGETTRRRRSTAILKTRQKLQAPSFNWYVASKGQLTREPTYQEMVFPRARGWWLTNRAEKKPPITCP